MGLRRILVVAGVPAVLLAAAWLLYPIGPPPSPPQPEPEPTFLYLYCPACHLEMSCSLDQNGKRIRCPRCKEKDVYLEINAHSRLNEHQLPVEEGFLVPLIGLGVTAGLMVACAFVYFLWPLVRRFRTPPSHYLFRCGGCGRKIRFEARQANHAVFCPGCKRPLVIPEATHARAIKT
jgi:DNA-directed RNA polymerase subunit RPC12/RpoP